MKNFNLIEMAKAMKEHKLRHMWRYAAMMALLLTLACGQVWGETSYYLFTPTDASVSPVHSGALKGDFITQKTVGDGTAQTIDGLSFTKKSITIAGSTLSGSISNKKAGDVSIDYDVKTTSTTFYLYVGGASSSIYMHKIRESGYTADSIVSQATGGTGGVKLTFSLKSSENTRICFSTGSTSIRCYQIVAVESGNPLPQPAQGSDYVLQFSRRYGANGSNTIGYIDGMEIKSGKDNKYATSTVCGFSKNTSTNYIKFTTGATCYDTLIVTANKNFSINTANTFPASTTTSGTKIKLAPSTTYWIMGQSSSTGNQDVEVSKIEFKKYIPGGGGCTSITPTWSTDYSSTTLNVGATSSTPVVGKDGSSGAVTFSSSDTYIATVNSSGVVTGVGAGTATITATVAANGDYCSGTVTKEFTIKAGVTYDANGADGGSVPADASTYAYNANITVAGNTGSLYKTGFVFNGWNTRSDGTGTHYEAGATMKMPSKSTGVTLYAEWVGYATSWEWWNCGQSNNSTTFTYITSKNYICSFASSASTAVASWDIEGGEYYRGIKIKTKDHSIAFWVQTGKRVSITFGTRPTKPTFTVGGVDKSSEVGASTNSDSITVTYTTTADTKFYIENETATNTAFTVKSVKIEDDAATGCSDWGLYYGTDGESDWDKTCFTQVGSTTEWQIEDFVIPDKPNWYVDNSTENDAKKVLSTWNNLYFAASQGDGARPMVGNTATGAVGTVRIYDNSGWNNRYAGFIPDGYKLKFGSTYKDFAVETGNEYRSEIVEYSSSNARDAVSVGIVDASGNYVSTDNSEGMQHLFLNTGGSSLWSTDNVSTFGLYNITGSSFSCLMTKVPGEDYLYEGWVPSTCTKVIFVRLKSSTLDWGDGNANVHNQTSDLTLESGKNYYTIGSWDNSGNTWSAYEKKGKFRMWNNSTEKNWYVNFYPYNVLTYNANGGSGAPAAQSVAADGDSEARTVAVAAGSGMTAPTGYTFNGWNTLAGGGGDSYAAGDSYTLTADATLYAQWAPILVTEISVSPSSKTLDVGGTQTLSATATPSTALDKTVTWSSSTTSVATVSSAGVVTAVAPGSATITATANDGSGTTGTCAITVNKITPTKYNFSVTPITICPGSTATLTLENSESGVTYQLYSDSSTPIAETQKAGTGSALTWTGLGAGTYRPYAIADATHNAKEMGSNKVTITTATATSITTQPSGIADATVDEAQTLSVTAAGTNLSYQWKESTTENGSYSNVASGGTSASYSVTPAAAGTKWYQVVVTGDCGEVTSNKVSIVAAAAVEYTVTYNANGGTVSPTSETVSTATLPTPTKTNYTFDGWYTSSGTKAGDAGDNYEPTGDITLYALWREDACAGGGGGGTSTVTYDFEPVSPITTSTYMDTYFTHSTENASYHSYSLASSNGGIAIGTGHGSYFLAGVIGSTSSKKAIYKTKESFDDIQSISFSEVSSDNGQPKYTIKIIEENDTEHTILNSKSHSEIKGSNGTKVWVDNYNIDVSENEYSGYVQFEVVSTSTNKQYGLDNITIEYGSGSATCYYVTYNGNGADSGFTKDEASHASGSDVTVASNSFSREGYTFTGWNTEVDGSGTDYAAGGTISGISGNMTLYAQWSSGTKYSVTYNGNDATDGSAPIDASSPYASGANVTVLGNTGSLEKTNYTFDGWNTANDGSGTSYAADGTLSSIAANVTLYAKWKQTVTLKTGSQGSGADQTPYVYINGTGVSSFTAHTADGYTLQGYYTAGSGGVKVLNADGTFAAANVTDYITSSKWSRTSAAPTLYAQWRAAAGKTCYTWDASETHPQTGTTNYDGLYLTATTKAKKQANSALTDTIYDVSNGSKCLTGHIGGTVIDSIIFAASTTNSDNNTFVIAFCSTQTFDTAKIIKVDGYQCVAYTVPLNTAAGSQVKVKAPAGTKSFILGRNYSQTLTCATSLKNSKERYLYYVRVCSASGGTHTISYNAGGGTGTMASNTGITDDGSQTLTTNSFTAPDNYTFAGWVADVDVTIGGSTVTAGTLIADGATITNITSDIALTAKWSQTITLDDNDANHGATGDGSATVYYNATSLASITHTTAASGYKLAGYYTAETSGTKVLNSDGSFAGDDITDWIDDGKWVQNDDDEPTLYAQYEVAGSIKWNLQVNSADAPIVTSSKNSSYTQISTSNMSNLTNSGLTVTASKKSELTSLISTPDIKGDDCMYVTFKVATGYKFTPSLIKAIIQPVGNGEHKAVEFSLADESSHTLASASATKCDGTSDGKKTTVTLAGDGTYFTGTVTLKIFVYKHADGTNSTAQYRLGTPIQIDGEIESTCTMPSYTSVSYSQTEYVQPASASAISVVGASGDPSYQWKYNSTGDRTSGTNCGTEASVTPSTESTGTLYYWCELTNACGTVKTPAVAITVSESKSDAPSIAWTDPASTPNYGGGGYTLRATVNDASWDGSASDLTLTAPAGIRIYNTTTGTDGSSKKYIEVKFDVQTAFDRETYSSNIPFTVSADATTSYNAISADHNVSYSACSGGGGSATEELMAVDASHINNSTWKGGWVYDGIGMMRYGHGSSDVAPGTKNANLVELTYKMADDDVDTYYKSSANHFGFYTEKAITGIRLYVHTTNDEVTVSGVYVANSAYTSGNPSSGSVSFTAEYNDDNESLRTGTHSGSAWVDITFASEVAAGKYGQINLSSNVRIAGMSFISASGSGATLTTTLAFATTGTIAKTQSAANFTNAASVTAYSETLGAITYSSSNTDCATVDSKTGEVTITASGASDQSTMITATLAASGCYKGATTTYTITVAGVSCTVNHGTLASDVTTKCSTADATLTLTGFDSGATVQWYKGESTISDGGAYAITTEGTTSTMVTKEVGTYSVMVTKDECSDRSNSITISNYSAEVAATKIVDKWYIKHGRVTPDIALWALDEGTHLSSVAWSPSNATGLTAADDFYESDGIVYLKGTEPSSNESSDVEYTLTLTVKDECENTTTLSTSDKQITLTHQKNTDKHVLAFVVTGTEKGGWTAGISADQTTNVELYNEIAKNFDVQATNIYSTDDEQKLKEYYSQFDILCITDYPNTGKTGTNKKSYVDAIGSLIDIRPILTMEAFVSKLDNWKSKGISGTPKSPTTRQYSMLLQCKDHEIFSGTNPTTVGSGDETMYRIDMVDKTLEDYATLDATYGAGAHAEKSGYEYGSKPALQGFTYDASMSSLLPIGRIDDGAGNDLEVGVERQAVMEARLLVLGINGYAMERLDDDGQTIVINALKYLMKKNAEDISDCSNYFVGGAEGDETNWFNLENWSGSSLPDRTQEVRIVAPCEISGDVARAASVKIVTGGKYNRGTQTARGQLTIESNGSLIVEGKIYAATAPNFFEQRTTEPEDLVVKADDSYTGTLIFDNEDGETQATIEMYSPSHWEIDPETGKYVKYWSYVGMPIKDVHIPDYFYGAFTYYFNEAKGWEKRFDNDIMQPFEGIGLSMQSGHKETFYGTLVSTENTDITITNHTGYGDGDNLIGNSWTAPIQIANFDAEDFGSCWATVYIFNTGKGGNTYVNANTDNDGAAKAGQWLGIPIGVAGLPEYTGLKVIPAMNAFLVHDTVLSSTILHLDYDKLVRDDATTNTQINEKMRAPSRHPRKKKDVDGLMRIRVVGEKTNTDVWMLQDARFSEGFDNGWEARYNPCDDRSAQLYARSKVGVMSFIALPDLDGTVLGFAPSRDGNDYTFTFQYRGEDEYYLNDLKLQQSVLIDADNNYAFTYEKGDTNRFYVSRTPLAPQTPTGVDNASGATQSTKAIKVIYNGKLYIIRSGRVYSAEGILVK